MSATIGSISAFFPCCNDEPTIGRLVRTVRATLIDVGVPFEVIVVDDGSTDGSRAALEALRDVVPELRLVVHPCNRGYGAALRSGFAAARKEWVFYTDGDGQYDPAQLRRLLAAAASDVDLVQGNKGRRADTRRRIWLGLAYRWVVRRAFRLAVTDVSCDFRLVRRELVDRVPLHASTGAVCVELVRGLEDLGARCVEVPVDHFPRAHGRSQAFRPAPLAATVVELIRLRLGRPARARAEK